MKYLLLSLLLVGCASEKPKYLAPPPDYANMPEYDCDLLPVVAIDPSKENILVIGDSISLLYTPYINLPNYNVMHNACNGSFSGHLVAKVDGYLAVASHFKVITFNAGVWDLNVPEVTVDAYIDHLKIVAIKLKAKADKVVFITTTNHPNFKDKQAEMRRRAIKELTILNVVIYDLGTYSDEIIDLKSPDLVHYTDEGSKLFGAKITEFLISIL